MSGRGAINQIEGDAFVAQQFIAQQYNSTVGGPQVGATGSYVNYNRSGKIHSSQQPSTLNNAITPQIYSQQRQRGTQPNAIGNVVQSGGVLQGAHLMSS